MKSRAGILFLILLGNSYSIIGQQTDFAFKNFSINEGLSQNSVIDIVEDPTGFIWFATQDGLNRFDGTSFIIFPASFDDFTSPGNTRLGRLFIHEMELWQIRKGGKIVVLDLYTHKEEIITSIQNQQLPPASSFLVNASGRKWVGTQNNGVYSFNSGKSVNHYSRESSGAKKILDNRVHSLFEDNNGFIWVLTKNGITRLHERSNEDFLIGKNTFSITQAGDSSIWVGTLGDGLFYKPSTNQDFKEFRGFPGFEFPPSLVIHSIHADKNKRIWVGTYGNGIFLIDLQSRTIIHLVPDRQNPFSISFQDIISIKEDKNEGIWIGTDGGGVNYYNRQFNNFKSIRIENVDPEISIAQLRSIVTDDAGGIWMGTSGQGLTYFDKFHNRFETFHLKPHKKGLSNYDRVVALEIDTSGDIWVGTQGNGLLILDGQSRKIKKWFTAEASSTTSKIPGNTVWKIFQNENNKMFLANGEAGMVLLDKEDGVEKRFNNLPDKKGEISGNVQTFYKINDTLIAVGFEEKGVQILNTITGNYSSLKNNLINPILKEETGIKTIFHDHGWLWIGTAGKGILITNLRTGKTYLVNNKNILPNNMIYSILPEREGRVWVSSNKGIFRIDYIHNAEKFAVEQVLPFTVADGLQSNEFNTGAYHKSKDGTIFFGGISGLTYFDPQKVENNRQEHPLVITGAMVGNQEFKSDTVITYKNRLNLKHWQNSLSFNYSTLDYLSPANMQFQYKLEGYEENWVNARSRNYTAYTNLPSDQYEFKVRAAQNYSMSAPLSSIIIEIATPFWKHSWFIALTIGILGLLIYALHRYRLNQVVQVQNVKNLISADLHDDLGARLTNIQFHAALFKHNLHLEPEQAKILDGIEKEVEASSKALDEIVWNIKMKDGNLDEVIAKMRLYAGEVLENHYQYQIDVDAEFSSKKMSMQKRREIFLVFKELLNNIRKHARATKVKIKFSMRNGMFYLAVKDNGRGFNPYLETTRNGISNIKERVERWKGKIKFKSQIDKGTLVELNIPFDQPHFN